VVVLLMVVMVFITTKNIDLCGIVTDEHMSTIESREDPRQTPDSRQQTADSRQQTADSRQQTADSRQQTANSRQQTCVA
jgi:hypothetical protein